MVDSANARSDQSTPHTQLAAARAQIAHLQTALHASRLIGMAMGILMCRHGWTEDRAFAALRTASQDRNRKLRDIAEQVVLTGDLST